MGHPQHPRLPHSFTRRALYKGPELQTEALNATNEVLRKEAKAQRRHLEVCRQELTRALAEVDQLRAQLAHEQRNVALLHRALVEVDAPKT